MPDREELLIAIREKRDTAARVRRLAQGISLTADQERLLQQAKELEAEVRQLERELSGDDAPSSPAPTLASTPPPGSMPMQTQQQQVQQQQQHEAEPDEAEPKPKPPKS
jgi:hypothetical protein